MRKLSKAKKIAILGSLTGVVTALRTLPSGLPSNFTNPFSTLLAFFVLYAFISFLFIQTGKTRDKWYRLAAGVTAALFGGLIVLLLYNPALNSFALPMERLLYLVSGTITPLDIIGVAIATEALLFSMYFALTKTIYQILLN